MEHLNLGLIGNCSISALVDPRARIVWSCMPRFDGDPVFCALLRKNTREHQGVFAIDLQNLARAEQRYLRNTAILVTTMYDDHGGIVEVTDFAPRFRYLGRMYYPMTLVRRIRRLAGRPMITVRANPLSPSPVTTPATSRRNCC